MTGLLHELAATSAELERGDRVLLLAGTSPCAFVPADASVSVAGLRTALRRTVPAYVVPTQWRAFEALPKNQNGKIDRRALQEQFSSSEVVGA